MAPFGLQSGRSDNSKIQTIRNNQGISWPPVAPYTMPVT